MSGVGSGAERSSRPPMPARSLAAMQSITRLVEVRPKLQRRSTENHAPALSNDHIVRIPRNPVDCCLATGNHSSLMNDTPANHSSPEATW